MHRVLAGVMAFSAAIVFLCVPAAPAVPVLAAAAAAARPPRPPAGLAAFRLAAARYYRVRPGDTLAGIAARLCGSPADWPGLWQANARQVTSPDVIDPGWVLAVACGTESPPPAGMSAAAPAPAAADPAPAGGGYPGRVNWAAVAACESGGDWAADTGNGFYGGLQFTAATWAAYGGLAFAPLASMASAAEQVTVALRVLASQGLGAWPVCGAHAHDPPAAAVAAAVRPAPVTPPGPGASLAARALAWAEGQAGVPYVWGGTGPGGYDCSGLVMEAYLHAGAALPRDTYEMLAAAGSLLIPVGDPQPGDLAFFGSGHVELYVRPGVTFGAQQPGTAVGFHDYGGGYAPTAFYQVR